MKRSKKHRSKKKQNIQLPLFSLLQVTCTPFHATPFVYVCVFGVSGCDLVQEGPPTFCRALQKRTQPSFHPRSAFMRILNILNLVFKVSRSILR